MNSVLPAAAAVVVSQACRRVRACTSSSSHTPDWECSSVLASAGLSAFVGLASSSVTFLSVAATSLRARLGAMSPCEPVSHMRCSNQVKLPICDIQQADLQALRSLCRRLPATRIYSMPRAVSVKLALALLLSAAVFVKCCVRSHAQRLDIHGERPKMSRHKTQQSAPQASVVNLQYCV